MTRTFDPRARNKRKQSRTIPAHHGHGVKTTCAHCRAPATEIALPSGTPVCTSHGDSRT